MRGLLPSRRASERARVPGSQGGDVSNERVAAGFENHGIIRQIKLERLRPFFPPRAALRAEPRRVRTPMSHPTKWIRPCLLLAGIGDALSFNYRLIYSRPLIKSGKRVD